MAHLAIVSSCSLGVNLSHVTNESINMAVLSCFSCPTYTISSPYIFLFSCMNSNREIQNEKLKDETLLWESSFLVEMGHCKTNTWKWNKYHIQLIKQSLFISWKKIQVITIDAWERSHSCPEKHYPFYWTNSVYTHFLIKAYVHYATNIVQHFTNQLTKKFKLDNHNCNHNTCQISSASDTNYSTKNTIEGIFYKEIKLAIMSLSMMDDPSPFI